MDGERAPLRLQAQLGAGLMDDADKTARGIPDLHWALALATSVDWGAKGSAARATFWRDTAVKQMSQGSLDERNAAELLRRGAFLDPQLAREMVFRPIHKALLLAAMVRSGADPSLLVLAEKLNYNSGFLHHVTARAIAQLKARSRAL